MGPLVSRVLSTPIWVARRMVAIPSNQVDVSDASVAVDVVICAAGNHWITIWDCGRRLLTTLAKRRRRWYSPRPPAAVITPIYNSFCGVGDVAIDASPCPYRPSRSVKTQFETLIQLIISSLFSYPETLMMATYILEGVDHSNGNESDVESNEGIDVDG